MKKSVKLYAHENVLEEFYSALADKDGKRILEQVHIPKSDVFYVRAAIETDRKSTRLNSSHGYISYAVFCLKNKTELQSRLHLVCRILLEKKN